MGSFRNFRNFIRYRMSNPTQSESISLGFFGNRLMETKQLLGDPRNQATSIGDRLIMMHCGRVLHDFRGAEKRRPIDPDGAQILQKQQA